MEESDDRQSAGISRTSAYGLAGFVLLYNAVMIYVSCFYHTAIMDRWQILWGLLFFIGGPAIVVVALAWLVRLVKRGQLSPLRTLLPCIAILSVVVWGLGLGSIGAYFRPRLFALVAADNEQRVLAAIRSIDDPNRVYVRGFRYPYCRMFTFGRYEDGALFLVVPSAPGPKDTILFDPNGVVPKDDWDHLHGPWYYRVASQ